MSDRPGSLAFAACFALVFAARAAAQPTPPIVASAPAAPEFLTRDDSHLSIASADAVDVDADPLDRLSPRSGLLGFRVLSR